MKKFALLLVVVAVGFAPAAHAQSESVTVSATVLQALSITKNQDLTFGDVVQGDAATIALTDAEASKMTITGAPSTSVSLSYDEISTLDDGSSNTLPFTQNVAYNATSDDASSATTASGGAASFSLNGSGDAYVYLGGTVTAGGSQVTGSYSGTVSFTVAYQ